MAEKMWLSRLTGRGLAGSADIGGADAQGADAVGTVNPTRTPEAIRSRQLREPLAGYTVREALGRAISLGAQLGLAIGFVVGLAILLWLKYWVMPELGGSGDMDLSWLYLLVLGPLAGAIVGFVSALGAAIALVLAVRLGATSLWLRMLAGALGAAAWIIAAAVVTFVFDGWGIVPSFGAVGSIVLGSIAALSIGILDRRRR